MPKIWSGPQECSWEVYAGDRNLETFEVIAGDPIDLTGAIIDAQARKSATDPVIALTAVITPLDPLLGTFTCEWDGEAVRTLLADQPTWTGVWDLQIMLAGEVLPQTLLRGTFTATHDVTRVGP